MGRIRLRGAGVKGDKVIHSIRPDQPQNACTCGKLGEGPKLHRTPPAVLVTPKPGANHSKIYPRSGW
jgi:hypothetical protein